MGQSRRRIGLVWKKLSRCKVEEAWRGAEERSKISKVLDIRRLSSWEDGRRVQRAPELHGSSSRLLRPLSSSPPSNLPSHPYLQGFILISLVKRGDLQHNKSYSILYNGKQKDQIEERWDGPLNMDIGQKIWFACWCNHQLGFWFCRSAGLIYYYGPEGDCLFWFHALDLEQWTQWGWGEGQPNVTLLLSALITISFNPISAYS